MTPDDMLGPARPLLAAALALGTRAAGTGDLDGAHGLLACAARLARRVRGLGEVADFRLERALDAAENEDDPEARVAELRDGLEALLGGDDDDDAPEPEPAAGDPDDPLRLAQALIGRAIGIGAPAYNTGDHQGCYDVYAATARAVLATVPGLPPAAAQLLRDGLGRAGAADEPNERAWAMRHAFDAVGDLSGDGAAVPPQQVRALLSMAIAIGAPAFNAGDHRGCYEVYACTARLLVNAPVAPDPMKEVLRRALTEACTVPNVTRQAWLLREAFDALLGAAE